MSEALSLAFKGSKNHRKRIRLTRRTRQMLKMGLRQPPPRCEPSQTRYQRFHATKTHSGHGSRATCRFGVNLDAKSKCILAESQAWIEDNQEKHQNDRSHDHGANL